MAKDTKSKPGTPAKPKSAGGAAQSGIPEATAVPSNATPAAAPKPGTAPKPAAKKGGKGKEKAAPPPPVPFEEHQRLLDEQLSKLKELQTAFDGLQASSSKDAAEANEREEKLKSQLAEREEIIGHLEKRTREQGDRIAELKESTVRMQADVAATLADGQKKLSEEEQRVQGAIADVRAEMEGMRNQLDELEQFRLRKADLERELDEMKATLEKKKHEFREGLRDMEVKSLRDKTAVKKQAMDMVNEAIASFKDVAEKQLSESTKQAMRENSMLESQLRLLSTKFAKILPINDSLRAKIKTLKTELVLSADRERILMGRTKKRDEVIKLLAEKLKECDGLLVKMVDEVERFVADGAQPVMRRRESTGRRGSLSGASAFPEPTSITVSNEAGRPVSPVQQDKIAGTPGSGSTATGFVPSVSAQRESVSRTLASVLGYNSDETPLPSPTAAFGMGTLAEEQDEEAESDYWGAPVAQGRSKREMSMTVVEALANQFRGKLESITGTANSPQTTVEGPS